MEPGPRWLYASGSGFKSYFLALTLVLLTAASPRAYATDDITPSDLEATARAIGFLNNLPKDGTITVGIVYADTADGKAKAAQTAGLLGGVQGQSKAKFRTVLIAAKDLTQTAETRRRHPDAEPGDIPGRYGRSGAPPPVVSISTDAGCTDAKSCVLMIHTAGRVRIVLDTALADAVGAQFSSIFMMMVERK